MFEKIINEIENQKVAIHGWLMSLMGILFIRFMLESISSPTSTGIIPSDPYTLIHYSLFFLCLTLGTSLVIGYFTKNYVATTKIVLSGLPLLWLAPIVDITLSGGKGYKMTYIFDTGTKLIFDFLTFFGPNLTKGATYGMRTGIALSIFGLGYYVWLKRKNLLVSLLSALCLYVLIFIVGSAPGLLYSFSHPQNQASTNSEVITYLSEIISKSTISHNTLREGISSVSDTRFIELGFNKLLSQILFMLSIIFSGLLFWKIDKEKFKAVIKNCRIERVNFYTASLFCGIGFAYINGLGNPFIWVDILGVTCLVISWMALWMHAVHLNDITDIDIDKISNKERPLIQESFDIETMKEVGILWLVIGLLGSWCAGFYPFFMSLIYVAASYIYSSPPLRLRRFPLIPSFLIGIACLATVYAGFFFVSTHKEIYFFPPLLAVGIVIMVTLAINFKDIKDIEGDRASGILTLPILFGKRGIQVVAICFALSIFLVPFFLSFYLLYVIALPASIIGYKLIMRRPYSEKPIFILRFFFLALIATAYLGIYWLAHIYKIT